MSDNSNIEEEVLRENGMTREEWVRLKEKKEWRIHQMNLIAQGPAQLVGKPKTLAESRADMIEKEIGKRRARKAEEQDGIEEEQDRIEEEQDGTEGEQDRIEGCLRVLHQGKGEEFYLRVMVDTGATINAITYGMLIDYDLETRKIRLDEPHVLRLAVGKFECSEQISLQWMGKGNEVHDTATFYVLPRGQANINDRVILSREWLSKTALLFDRDPSPSLRPLIGGQQSASEKAARMRERQRAMDDKASSSNAKEAYQKKKGQQESSSTGLSQPKEARS